MKPWVVCWASLCLSIASLQGVSYAGDSIPKAAWKRGIGEPLSTAGTKKPNLQLIDDGYAQGAPSVPYFAPRLKSDAGITPTSGQVAPRIENALTIAATGGEGLIPRLFEGAIKEGLSEVGQYAGQKVAQATDPRLAPILETGGAVAASGAPYEQGGSLLSTLIRRRSGGGPGDRRRRGSSGGGSEDGV